MRPWVVIPLIPMGFALIDKRDVMRVVRHRWRRAQGAPVARIGKKVVRLARYIMQPSAKARVLNGCSDPYDCRRENLRVTAKQGRGL